MKISDLEPLKPRQRAGRRDFPLLASSSLRYLDSAATTQKPAEVLDAERLFYETSCANVHRGVYQLSVDSTARYEGARQRVCSFLGARSASEIVFTRGTTEAVNLVAQSWGALHLQRGDRIVVSVAEHHSNFVPWQVLAQEKHCEFVVVDLDDAGAPSLDNFAQAITPRTKIVACTAMSNVLGVSFPISDIAVLAHKVGAVFMVDAAQAGGRAPLDVATIDCDFLAFSGHKAYGPFGIGALYIRGSIAEQMRPYQYGGEMINAVSISESSFKSAPYRFEAGTPNVAGACTLHAALDFIDAQDRNQLAHHERHLAQLLVEGLRQIDGVRILGPLEAERSGIVSFMLDAVHPHDLAQYLDTQSIAIRAGHMCTQPLLRSQSCTAISRASFAVYNDRSDVEALLGATNDAVRYFRRLG